MRSMQKTLFSNLSALALIAIDEVVHIQSHDATVGYFVPEDAYEIIGFAIRQALMSLEEGYDAPKIRDDLRAARDLLDAQEQGEG